MRPGKDGKAGITARSLATGDRATIAERLTHQAGNPVRGSDGILRHVLRNRGLDGADHLFVAAPAGAKSKQRSGGSSSGGRRRPAMDCSGQSRPVDYAQHRRGREEIGDVIVTIDENVIQARIGANIKARREKLGLAQTTLGERSGIHRTYVNQLENGHKNLTVVVLARLAEALGTTPSALTKGILSEEDRGEDSTESR